MIEIESIWIDPHRVEMVYTEEQNFFTTYTVVGMYSGEQLRFTKHTVDEIVAKIVHAKE